MGPLTIEPMESLRYTNFLNDDGWLITNKKPFINIPDYPDHDSLWQKIENLPNSILVDGDKLARQVATVRSMNIVVLGAASLFLELPAEDLEKAISTIFNRKGEAVVNQNLAAFRSGRAFAEEKRLAMK